MATPTSKDLRQNLLHKLRGGDRRYAHLNATTARSRQKIDFKHLNLINDGLADDFLSELLSTDKLSFQIPLKDINKRLLEYTNRKKENLSEDKAELLQELQKLSITKKGLEFLDAHQREEFSELGTKSFAFGYPLLLKQVGGEKDDVICAPLFLWYLNVERDYRTDSLVLSRDEDSPILFNEMLDYYLESELKLDFSDTVELINTRIFDDGLLDKSELHDSARDISSKLSSDFPKINFEELASAPSDRKAISKLLEDNNATEMILNSGIFGIFRSGKQSIINDLKGLIALEANGAIENEDFEQEQEYPFTVINTDPTQERVIESLGSHQNLIIQGPPGTGKSQTLTALITNALANGQRTLVVCEKRTAMEIIKRNLDESGLEDFVALIESVNQDRGTIVDRARAINESKNIPHYNVRAEFESAKSLYQNSALGIARHHDSIAALTKQYGDKGVYGQNDNKYFLGKYLKLSKEADQDSLERCETEFYKIPFSFNSVEFDLLLSELEEVKDKVQTVESQLRLIPITEIPRTNYQQDHDVIESYFEGKRTTLADSYELATKHRNIAISNIREKLSAELANIQSLAIEGLSLLSVSSESFDWRVQGEKITNSAFRSLPSYAAASPGLSSIQDYEDEMTRCMNIKKQVGIDTAHKLGVYKASLGEIVRDIKLLNSYGVENPAISASDAVLSVFGSKRKEVKALKAAIAHNISVANRSVADVSNVLDIEKLNVEHLSLESSEASLNKIPAVKELIAYINKVTVPVLLPENTISRNYADKTVGEYVDCLVDDQFAIYEDLKPLLAEAYAGLLQNSVRDYYKNRFEKIDLNNTELSSFTKSLEKIKTYGDDENDVSAYAASVIDQSRIDTVNGLSDIVMSVSSLLEPTPEKYSQALAPNSEALGKATISAEVMLVIQDAVQSVDAILTEIQDKLFSYYKWCVTYNELSPQSQRVVALFIENQVDKNDWLVLMQAMYFRKLVTISDSPSLLNDDTLIERLITSNKNIKGLLIATITAKWSGDRLRNIGSFEKGLLKFNSLYNKRGARGQRRNSLRKIIDKDFELFTSLFPVVICNPSSVASLFTLKKDLFDLVLFDEASQLRLEDTYTSLYRGRVKIVSGDQHQMPPSSYFQSVADGDDDEYEDDEGMQVGEMTNAESLLDYAGINGYTSEMLKIHYRSDHEDLIQFSNHAFYDAKLMPIPKFSSYIPIEYKRVNGEYEDRANEAEADYVIQWLKSYFADTPDLQSVGVVTLNLPQAELIKEKIANERTDSEEFNQSMLKLDELGFFVKNLENVQGDERDIMILSTTFGKDKSGKFKQFFGPLNNNQGYRLLNVLVTRAKHKFIVITSIPDENINRYQDELNIMGKDKKAIFYTYLAYARAVADGDKETKDYILNLLSSTGQDKIIDTSGYTESPFEEEVLEVLEQAVDKDRIVLQYQVGGENFRIDMVILNKECTAPMLAIECDGYAYHSSPQAYLYDAYRREILKAKGGFDFYSIWSTNWFHDLRNEEAKLIATIREYDSK